MNFDIFVSYSHADAAVVQPLTRFLLPTGATVFRDEDAIAPGTRWELRIAQAIRDCRVLYLFWCCHAGQSAFVRSEVDQALALGKAIVPVRLDDTPLPAALGAFQWVDLRPVIGTHEEVVEQRISRSEGEQRQRLDREAHGGGPGRHGYFDGDFARDGWTLEGDEYRRRVTVQRPIAADALARAGSLLEADIVQRVRRAPAP